MEASSPISISMLQLTILYCTLKGLRPIQLTIAFYCHKQKFKNTIPLCVDINTYTNFRKMINEVKDKGIFLDVERALDSADQDEYFLLD